MPVYVFNTFNDPSAFARGVTDAVGVNDTDQIVGFFQGFVNGVSGVYGYLESGGTYTTLDDPSATLGTQAFGINNSGQIVGALRDASGTHGFLPIQAASFHLLTLMIPRPPAAPLHPASTTAGQIVGYYSDATRHPRLPPKRRHVHHARRSLGHRRHLCTRHQRLGPDRRILQRRQRHPRVPLQQRRHLHHPRRSLGHLRHLCVRHQRCGPDRRALR